jgi:transposase
MKGTAHDSPVLRVNLDKIETTRGPLSADKAYFARVNCVKAESKGLRPYIMPEGEPNVRGPKVFKGMVRMRYLREEEFDEVYHTGSIAETIIERIKQRTGEILLSIREDLQGLELRLKGIVNNLLAANLMRASTIIGELPLIPV